MNNLPKFTRLRFVTAKDPNKIVSFLEAIGTRVQIYGSPVWDGKKWFLWFVPNDRGIDVESKNL